MTLYSIIITRHDARTSTCIAMSGARSAGLRVPARRYFAPQAIVTAAAKHGLVCNACVRAFARSPVYRHRPAAAGAGARRGSLFGNLLRKGADSASTQHFSSARCWVQECRLVTLSRPPQQVLGGNSLFETTFGKVLARPQPSSSSSARSRVCCVQKCILIVAKLARCCRESPCIYYLVYTVYITYIHMCSVTLFRGLPLFSRPNHASPDPPEPSPALCLTFFASDNGDARENSFEI